MLADVGAENKQKSTEVAKEVLKEYLKSKMIEKKWGKDEF